MAEAALRLKMAFSSTSPSITLGAQAPTPQSPRLNRVSGAVDSNAACGFPTVATTPAFAIAVKVAMATRRRHCFLQL